MKTNPSLFKQVLVASVVFWLSLNTGTALAQAPAVTPAPTIALTVPPAVDNPYGLEALWGQGDWVAKITILLLLIMSLASWYVLISKLIAQHRLKKQTAQAKEAFANARNLREGADALTPNSPFNYLVESVLEDAKQHSSVAGQVDLNTWAAQSVERTVGVIQGDSQRGLAVLATVGSTAPFVGLFGTVWGIYNALVKIGASGQASIDKVAGPVGEALIMTAIGLAVAVPAVLGYNWLVRRNKVGMDAVRAFGSDLHTTILKLADKTRQVQKSTPVSPGARSEVAVPKVAENDAEVETKANGEPSNGSFI